MNILFVCTGNTCRSPMAAAYFAKICRESGLSDIHTASAGVAAPGGQPMSCGAEAVLREQGISVEHTSQTLTEEHVRWADRIVTMTDRHKTAAESWFPAARGKTVLLSRLSDEQGGDIPDPFGGTVALYRECLESMKPPLRTLAEQLADAV